MSNSSMLFNYKKQLSREMCLRLRDFKSMLNAVLFFLMIIVFFPLTIPANSSSLNLLTPGIIWVGLIFATFLSAEHLFSQDYADGVVEQWFVSSIPVTIIVLAKLSIHCLIIVGSLLLLSPLIAILLKLTWYQVLILDASVVCAIPTIVALCALAEAFAAGIKQKTLIMGLIVLPLNIPVLIIGSSIMRAALMNEAVSGMLAILLAISLLAWLFVPLAIAGVIKICLVD